MKSEPAHVEESALSSEPNQPRRRKSRFSNTALQLGLNIVALGLFAVLVLFVQTTYSAEQRSHEKQPLDHLLKTDVSTTLAVLRASQGLLSAITGIALNEAFIFLQWTLINTPDGLSYLSLLALSPTTGNFGTIALVRGSASHWRPKLWALLRVSLTITVWLSGLVLFFNTSIVTVYDTAITYNVTAGVGPFNSSLVDPFFAALASTAPGYPYSILPFTYFAAVYILVVNPLISTISEPVHCVGPSCVSYLLSGGLSMVAPWQDHGLPEYPMVKVNGAPSMQFDFSGPIQTEFPDGDCDVFGQHGFAIGIRVCVSKDQNVPGGLSAGLFVCTKGTDGDACRTALPRPNITTSMSFFAREATFVASRSNYTIVSVEDTTPPVLLPEVDLFVYRQVLRWLLNYTAAGVPAPSSISQSFWSSPEQLADPTTYGILAQNFQSILVFPFWLFQSNNWGNTALQSNKITPSLPQQFYTTASVVAPYDKIRFDRAMFILFLALQVSAMIFVWGVLFWVWFGARTLLRTSSYPLFDVAFKSQVDGETNGRALSNAGSWDVIRIMKDAKAVAKRE